MVGSTISNLDQWSINTHDHQCNWGIAKETKHQYPKLPCMYDDQL